ncbi:flagellin [Chromatiales bacterium (ex Bugula neritina AB1)]|nr:flagellin [Chromatiales bacterium (ex Bugula neritina AB1)]
MPQTINTNVPSLTAQRNLNSTQGTLQVAMQRLSSGLRINSARDDAAGLAIAERMHGQVRGMNVAVRNANDAISMAQVAEGGLNEIGNMLQRMRELAVQSANGTNSTGDRLNLDAEFQALNTDIGRTAEVTKFNNVSVIGDDAATFTFQVGANSGETLDVGTTDMDNVALGIDTLDITDSTNATAALTAMDTAIDLVTSERAKFGAAQSQFTSAINNLQVGMENQAAARGRIVDADFAVETANLTRAQILQQAGTSMVAQANSGPQGVLSLLG